MVREINLSNVLGQLNSPVALSRAQMAGLIGLNKSTISSLVDELIGRGLVIATGLSTSSTGRPGTLLELNPDAGCGIGLEIGVDFILIVITDFLGKVLWRKYESIETSASQEDILMRASNLADEAKQIALSFNHRLMGLGLTVPGMVDIEQGVCVFSPNLGWRNVPLKQMFYERLGTPVFVDNDATAAALGEHLFGCARQIQDFIFALVGVGIGCGLFLNGNLYRGSGGYAGEIGHTILGVDVNRPCRCGHRGCWETYGNQYSLMERMNARLHIGHRSLVSNLMAEDHTPLSLEVITKAAEAGDQVTLEVLSETGEAIGMGIANMVDIFNPAMVVIGGSLSVVGPYLLPSIKTVVEGRALREPFCQTQLILSGFGRDAVVMGAVGMVVKSILTDPTQVGFIGNEK